jgi:hypothetical protein
MSDKTDYSDVEFEIASLNKKILELESENQKMKQVIVDNDLEDEIEGLDSISEEEYICVKGIGHLKKLYENGTFGKDDTQQLDILIKNLRLIRGQSTKKPKGNKLKTEDVGELFSIVKGK